MDPFSLVVGIGSLIEMSLALGKCLKDAYEAAASFEEEMGSLLREIQDLDSVNKSIEHLYRTETSSNVGSERLDLPVQEREVWQNTIKILQECTKTARELQNVLGVIVGKHGVRTTGLRDRITKQLRKQSKDGELNLIRIKISGHRESLNVSLTLLNLVYAQRGSTEAQKLGFQLHRQIASFESRFTSTETDLWYDSLHSATTVASTLHLNKHFDTPKSVSSIYTGRKDYLDGLKQAFDLSHSSSSDDRPPHRRFVVFGLGGSGKTQFCCKFASDNKQRFWGVFTVDASSPSSAQQSFIAIAKACGTHPNERAAKSWLSSSDRPWLLIIDNADDTNLDIEKYFPDGEHGLTLITTRNPSVKMHGTIGERSYHFERLNDDEASELLLRAADNCEPRTPTIMELALAITKKLGALPLALVHAGNAIKAKYCKLNEYIHYYEENWKTIRQSQQVTGQDEDDEEYMKVYASYEIVYRGLESFKSQKYRDAVQLLKLFSFLHYEHIPFELLRAAIQNPRIQQQESIRGPERVNDQKKNFLDLAWQLSSSWLKSLRSIVDLVGKKQFEIQYPTILPTFLRDAELSSPSNKCIIRLRGALHLLTQLSLITCYESSDSYSMHPLVHTWVRERPQMRARLQAVWCEAALQTLSRCVLIPPLNQSVDPHGDLARKLLPHMNSVRRLQQKIEEEFISNRDKRNRLWPALQTRITPWRAMFLVKCAVVYSECGEFVETENCLRAVMGFYNEFLGQNHPRTEKMLLGLSDSLWQQCRVHDAADLQEEIFERNIKFLGPEHPRTLTLMAKLGETRREQGRFAESIELLTKAVDGMKAQLPVTDPATYYAMEQLGMTMRACFHFNDARMFQEQAVAGMQSCLGDKDTKTLVAMGDLAITYHELGTTIMYSDSNLAKKYLESAHRQATFVLKQLTEQIGDKQPHTWMAQGFLGRIKAAMGNVDEADSLFSSLLPVAARHLGDDHLRILSHKNYYAKILIQQKRFLEAESLLEDISKPAKYKIATSTGDYSDRWDTLWTLVDCYEKQGKITSSLTACDELLDSMRAVRHGKEQTETSSTFWRMVLAKKAELKGAEDPGITSHSDSGGSGSSMVNITHSTSHTVGSSFSQVSGTSASRRVTTW